MGKGQKTKSHKRKVVNKTPIMCNVSKTCNSPASFDFIMAMPTDRTAKEYSGCDNCILTLHKSMNAVLLDGT